MRGGRNGARQLGWALLTCLLVAGCKGSPGEVAAGPGSGAARLALTSTGMRAKEIASVSVSVTSGEASGFPAIPADLARTGAQWNVRIPSIPAGEGRRFEAVARDASGAELHRGWASGDTDADATGMVSIVLADPGSPANDVYLAIQGLSASRASVLPGSTMSVTVTPSNPHGGPLTYAWDGTCGLFADRSSARTRWTAPPSTASCQLTIRVTNERGTTATAYLSVPVAAAGEAQVAVSFNSAPVITGLSAKLTQGTPTTGDLQVVAVDPDGDPLAFAWSSSCPGITFAIDVPYGSTAPHLTVPDPSRACVLTVTVTDGRGGQTTGVLSLPANPRLSDPCWGKADGAACDDLDRCTSGDSCRGGTCTGITKSCASGQTCDPVDGACKDGAADKCAGVTCTARDQCHQAGSCDPATGACSSPNKADGTACSDGLACTRNDVCGAGVCVPGPKVSCPAGQACDPGDGSCKGGVDPCAGVVCTPSDPCHEVGVCNPTTGACSNPASADGKACNDGKACTQTDTCQAGACVGGNPMACTSPAACVEPGGTCRSQDAASLAAIVSVQEGSALGLAPGFGYDAQGNVYQGGNIFQPGFDFGTGVVTSAGGSDIVLARLDPTTGRATGSTWVRSYGDAANDQTLQALAVSAAHLGVIGNFQGLLDFGGQASLANPGNLIDYVAGIDPATGIGLWIKGVDLNDPTGPTGRLLAIASTPGQTRFAVCGFVANKVAASIVDDPAASAGSGLDIVVSVLDGATGNLLWGKQFGGAGDQTCSAVAFDDAGDVVITGAHKGTLAFSPLAALPLPTGSNSWAYVARLNGTTGVPSAAVTFGATGTSRASSRAVAVDAGGNVSIAGQFQGKLDFGGTILTAAGTSLDAFAAKLGPTLSPIWAVRLGGSGSDDARAVATDSAGNVYVTGVVVGPVTGAATLPGAGGNDAFLLRLDPVTGSTTFASGFGDALAQEGNTLVIARLAAGPEKDALWMTGHFSSSIAFAPLPALTCPVAESRKFLVKMK